MKIVFIRNKLFETIYNIILIEIYLHYSVDSSTIPFPHGTEPWLTAYIPDLQNYKIIILIHY